MWLHWLRGGIAYHMALSMESTWGGALCWQRTKQETKWTPGQIKIHQDIWIGCPVSKLFAGIESKVKRNVPLLHISVITVASECVRHAAEWKNLLNWLVWFLTLLKGKVRYGKQRKSLEMENPPCFFTGGHASTAWLEGKPLALSSSWPFGKMPTGGIPCLPLTASRVWGLGLPYEGRRRINVTGQPFSFLALWSALLCPSHL